MDCAKKKGYTRENFVFYFQLYIVISWLIVVSNQVKQPELPKTENQKKILNLVDIKKWIDQADRKDIGLSYKSFNYEFQQSITKKYKQWKEWKHQKRKSYQVRKQPRASSLVRTFLQSQNVQETTGKFWKFKSRRNMENEFHQSATHG
ncbi:unnamed protein product, partial [Owenia fusiformis]